MFGGERRRGRMTVGSLREGYGRRVSCSESRGQVSGRCNSPVRQDIPSFALRFAQRERPRIQLAGRRRESRCRRARERWTRQPWQEGARPAAGARCPAGRQTGPQSFPVQEGKSWPRARSKLLMLLVLTEGSSPRPVRPAGVAGGLAGRPPLMPPPRRASASFLPQPSQIPAQEVLLQIREVGVVLSKR